MYICNKSTQTDPHDSDIVHDLKKMLDENNPLAKAFRMARDQFDSDETEKVRLKLIGRRGADGRRYNMPTASEVAALIIGDICNSTDERDIVIETQSGSLQRINELRLLILLFSIPYYFHTEKMDTELISP